MHEMGNKPLGSLLSEQPDERVYPKVYLKGPDAMAVPSDMEVGTEGTLVAQVRLTTVTKGKNGDREVMLEIVSAEVRPPKKPDAALTAMYPSVSK